jgi:pimeloyl-ACP methyl ester carboxylesterase
MSVNNDAPLPPGFTSGYVHTEDGIRLHYVQGGHGTPVVLLHGFPENWYEWHKIMPALALHYQVIALDMRGAGQSDAPPTGYDKATLAKDVRGVVEQLHLGTINLVGHDIGMMVAYTYAATYPTEVRHLALMEAPIPDSSIYTFPALSAQGPGLWWFGLFGAPRMPQILLQGREDQFITEFFRDTVPVIVVKSITQEDATIYANNMREPSRLNAYISYFGTFPQDVPHMEQLRQRKLSMPVLTMGADHSLGAAVGEQVEQYATHVRSVVIANSGHWLPEEHPEEVLQYLMSFFGE